LQRQRSIVAKPLSGAPRGKFLRLSFVYTAALILVTASSGAGLSATAQPAKTLSEVELRVHKVGLGSSYATVRRQLGKPRRIMRETDLDDTCGPPSRDWTLLYDGMAIKLQGSLGRDDFEVVSIKVTSAKWLLQPGIRVSQTRDEVRKKLGSPLPESSASSRRLQYVNKGNDGFALLEFAGDRLVKVTWESNLC
jgi:hypothetical protein